MARISGIDLPRDKRVEIGLTYIFGIGVPTSKKILAQTKVNPDTRVKDLTTEEEQRIREVVETLAPLDRTPCSPGEREAAEP